jgi:hypothetical protein
MPLFRRSRAARCGTPHRRRLRSPMGAASGRIERHVTTCARGELGASQSAGLNGGAETLELPQPADQWVPTGENLVHNPSLRSVGLAIRLSGRAL